MAGKRGRYRLVSVSERRVIVARFREGARVKDVMAEFGLAHSSASRIKHEAALMRRRVAHSPHRLSFEERERISRGIAVGESARAIARALGRAPSTVSREIRAAGGRRRYRAVGAERRAQRCARRPKATKLSLCPALVGEIERGLALGWSPQQISADCVSSSLTIRDAHQSRDDLSVVVRAVARRVAPATDRAVAHGTRHPSPRGRQEQRGRIRTW